MSAISAALTLTSLSVPLLFILVAYIITIAIHQGLALFGAIQTGEFSPDVIQDRIAAMDTWSISIWCTRRIGTQSPPERNA